jgi:hypothetical protein
MCKFYVNTVPFTIRDLSICRFGYLHTGPGTNPLQTLRSDRTNFLFQIFLSITLVPYLKQAQQHFILFRQRGKRA